MAIDGSFGAGAYGEGPFGGIQPGQPGYTGDQPTYRFTTPTVDERWDTHPLLRRLRKPVGVAVLKVNGFYKTVREPTVDQINSADLVYLGGHDHHITAAAAADLNVAGYGPYLSPL